MPTMIVTVNAAGTAGAVNPPQQHVPHAGQATPLSWRIATPNYAFPVTGAVIWKIPGAPFQATYTLTNNNTLLTLDDSNVPGTYTYNIIVNPTNSATAITIGRGSGPGALLIDPTIINDQPSE